MSEDGKPKRSPDLSAQVPETVAAEVQADLGAKILALLEEPRTPEPFKREFEDQEFKGVPSHE